MRKGFAWIEAAAAVVLAISAIVGYIQIQLYSTGRGEWEKQF